MLVNVGQSPAMLRHAASGDDKQKYCVTNLQKKSSLTDSCRLRRAVSFDLPKIECKADVVPANAAKPGAPLQSRPCPERSAQDRRGDRRVPEAIELDPRDAAPHYNLWRASKALIASNSGLPGATIGALTARAYPISPGTDLRRGSLACCRSFSNCQRPSAEHSTRNYNALI